MNEPQAPSDRNRLKELLAIPERDRTDEQWDQIHELEIVLAPGNRDGGPDANTGRKPPGQQQGDGRQQSDGRQHQARPQGGKSGRRFRHSKRGPGGPG
jgi:hypothetical protein